MLLNELAVKYNADKKESCHNYVEIYSKYFDQIRLNRLNFLEIGIYSGSSLLMWNEYFPNSTIHGIDITNKRFNKLELETNTNIKTYIIDQSSPLDLDKFFKNEKFDIVIDDGSHKAVDQEASFEYFLPKMNSGGLYIVEDIHTAYSEGNDFS